ncbi:MAG: tRNA (guanine(37)-N1)-methyltransferase Trm5b [Cenarchaeum symbiont of Oopsacas minuta]|nr:tRNA (guanine(37)-N1)-methyltransferase Trm5b [Cenarchaeum symbiont of Oopsacas minuta]
MLRRILKDILSEKESEQLYSAFDQVGDVIVTRIPESLESKKPEIGEALLGSVKMARAVFCQTSDVSGDHRTRKLELIAGKGTTQTEYKESGCRFAVDVEKAFFSPRLSTERSRIARLVQDGEIMLNMFAGIGMFSILAAANSRCTVYSVDLNPIAATLCKQSIRMNKLLGDVISIEGDITTVIREQNLTNISDHTLMLLPEKSDEFVSDAISATKSGGIIHYYAHVHAETKSGIADAIRERWQKISFVKSEILTSKLVRAVGPRYYQAVADVRITK